jgi:amino-acid N-acetyltransferase
MEIQPATSDDSRPIRGLLETSGLPHDDLAPAHLRHFLVARDGDRVVGIVGLEPRGDAALLRSLAVAPERRNEGLGARLVDAIERHAGDNSIRTLYLLTTTAADYFGACGYERVDRDALPEPIQQTEEAARLCPSSATCMRKSLATT